LMVRYGSVCSGIEAATAAWHPLGWEPAWFSEIAPFPCAVLNHHYPNVPNLGDMTAIDVNEQLADIDVLIGGTPCQAFSVAGLRKSLDDERGNLSLAFCRLARRIAEYGRLKFVVWENVPGCLNMPDNAFGCILSGFVGESVPLAPAGPKWTNAGAVYGPEGSAAWRVLDAQFFGLAQRRKRVFVVVCPGGWADPASVLFESQGVRRNPPTRRQAGERIAASLTRGADSGGRGGYAGRRREDGVNIVPAKTSSGRGFSRAGESRGQDPLVVTHTHTHTHTQGLSRCLNAGGMNRRDFETETLIPVTGGGFDDEPHAFDARQNAVIQYGNIAGPLDMNGQSIGVVHSLRAEGFDASEDGTGRGTPIIPIDMRQASRGDKMTNNRGVDACSSGAPGTGIGQSGDPAPTLGTDHPPAIAFAQNQRDEVCEMDCAGALAAEPGMKQQTYVAFQASQYGVRRLTPRECERLQGFPDNYTLIEYRGKVAADGPRYQALGNSMAVPCIQWIARRILTAIQHEQPKESESA
jgi:DNA (cytosine-5)-methyltransferase 1